ncbi:MAG: adenosylcobinamide-GDP ribazoletransferase [Synechococcus sp.]|nr:adenosylcobinamide-GDP ribazoletransferase [Synechococcus sp.]
MASEGGEEAGGWLGDLAGAWIFYTVLPAWPVVRPRFTRIARFAPWIGVLLGGSQALLWLALEGRAPVLTQAALVVLLGSVLTGGLHADGAMDTADGLAAGERCHEAMADSRVGASGVLALAQLLLLRLAGLAWLAAAAPAAAAAALVWAGFWGRVAPLIAMARFPYRSARGTAAFHRQGARGLARELRPAVLLLAIAGAGWALLGGAGGMALLAGAAGVLPAVAVPLGLGRRLGSHSGDSYGACVEWVEAFTLLLAAALLAGSRGGAG